jgi:hypothetical protein
MMPPWAATMLRSSSLGGRSRPIRRPASWRWRPFRSGDALAGDIEVVADLLERLAAAHAKAKPAGDDLAVAVAAQFLEDLLDCVL